MNVITETLTVAEEMQGLRLDRFLTLAFPEYSRTFLQKLIREGRVFVNGRLVRKPRVTVSAGETARVELPVLITEFLVPEAIPLEILYEDEYLVAVNKPPDMVTHPSRGHGRGTLANALLHHCSRQISDVNGPLRPGIVHRLDRNTSGVILCAKTNAAHRGLSAQFHDRRTQKRYWTIVRGCPEHASGEIALAIERDPRLRERMRVAALGGRPALTRFYVEERFPRFARLRVEPRTGRTHQIRVHLSACGHPVAADALYGGGDAVTLSDVAGRPRSPEEPPLIARQALHAECIAFDHPITGVHMELRAELPPDLQAFLAALRAQAAATA